jgi:uncharacterized lipoprotein YddW (UPF0748 family)
LALVWLPQQSQSAELDASTPPGGQFRAYWVDAFGDDLFDAPRIDAIVASTKAAHSTRSSCRLCGVATASVTARPCAHRSGRPAPFPFDAPTDLIDKAHAQGIEVHAWVIATAMWRSGPTPASPAHAFNQHGRQPLDTRMAHVPR